MFGIASVMCAVATSAEAVIAFRAVQGLGAALIFPVSVSVLTNALPAARAGHAIGLAYGIAGLGNAAGPADRRAAHRDGGLAVDLLAQRALDGAGPGPRACAASPNRRTRQRRAGSTSPGWRSSRSESGCSQSLLIGHPLGMAVAANRRRVRRRAIAARRVRGRGTPGACAARRTGVAARRAIHVLVIAGTIANIAYGVTIFLSTMYLQEVRGLDPLMAGLAFLGPSAGAALGGALSGRLAARASPVLVMGFTTVLAAVSLAALSASNGWVAYLPALTACGFTMGLVYAFTTVATQAVVRPERAGEAAGIALTALVTMAGVGVAASSTVLEVLEAAGVGAGAGSTPSSGYWPRCCCRPVWSCCRPPDGRLLSRRRRRRSRRSERSDLLRLGLRRRTQQEVQRRGPVQSLSAGEPVAGVDCDSACDDTSSASSS